MSDLSAESPVVTAYENFLHDIKIPMSILYHNIQHLEYMDELSGSALEYVAAIKKCWFRALKLVNDTNDQCMMQYGHFAPKFSNCDMVALLKEITALAIPLGDGKSVSISFDASVRKKVMATDKNLMDRIIMNLLSNSIKFTGKNGKIKIMLKDKGGSVRIVIRDSGSGIPSDTIPDIFKRYYRGSNKEYAPGNGLGLSIVREFTQLLGGSIRILPRRQGTEAILDLPVFFSQETPPPAYVLDDFNYINVAQIEFSENYLEA